MSEVSSRLRRAREQAGLQIEEISARTKIKPAFLRALETGHFETLPGHFFTRAFLKAYAREVGLPPEMIVAEFDRAHGTAKPVELDEITAARDESERVQPPRPLRPLPLARPGWQMAAAITLALVVIAVVNRPQPAEVTAPEPVGTTGSPAAPPVVSQPEIQSQIPETLTIHIQPAETIWVAATADGASAVYKLLQPGQQVSVTGREMSFRIGNAAAFVYSINGTPGKPIGGRGEVREFRISTANYRTYLN